MSRPAPAEPRPVPTCHRTVNSDTSVHTWIDDTGWDWREDHRTTTVPCIGSLCSAFARVPSPVDPLARQGVCGLVGGKCEPWPDTAPAVGEVGGE